MAEVGPTPHEALISLCHRLETLPAATADRKSMVAAAVALYGVSRATSIAACGAVDRAAASLKSRQAEVIPAAELERDCETIEAMKSRILNGKGRHLSTHAAIRILEAHGVEKHRRPVRSPPTRRARRSANRHRRSGATITTDDAPAATVRLQAQHSNAPRHFRHRAVPTWKQVECLLVEPGAGAPTLMIERRR